MSDIKDTLRIMQLYTKENITDEEAKELGYFIHDSFMKMANIKEENKDDNKGATSNT